MTADDIEKFLDDYFEYQSIVELPDSVADRIHAERRMASIKSVFQRAGLDINEYL